MSAQRRRRAGVVLAAVAAVVLGLAVLWPDGSLVNRGVVAVYVFFLQRGMPQAVLPEHYAAVLNVLGFVPLGWLGVVLLRRGVLAVTLGLGALSVLVELVQLLPVLQREASLLDVACNTGGALVGALVASRADQQPHGDEGVDERRDVRGDDVG
ncbi:VanZ family protein [Phycicoccus flavus]|uniref:VanZ family protein n=1 Tax=Phycicoccus flavus TaxID=2502783 RepID=A0A8T6R7I7_9MICO|nr:VanZ family protein [Phycicoccus flavus]NHA68795.1 VanZ family protein [Phycicoccus flavus]